MNTPSNIYDEQCKAALAFINETPVVQSCLYDLDLMPEQLNRGSKEWDRMLLIVFHFREGLSACQAKLREAEHDLTRHIQIVAASEARAERLEKALSQIAEKSRSPWRDIARAALPIEKE